MKPYFSPVLRCNRVKTESIIEVLKVGNKFEALIWGIYALVLIIQQFSGCNLHRAPLNEIP